MHRHPRGHKGALQRTLSCRTAGSQDIQSRPLLVSGTPLSLLQNRIAYTLSCLLTDCSPTEAAPPIQKHSLGLPPWLACRKYSATCCMNEGRRQKTRRQSRRVGTDPGEQDIGACPCCSPGLPCPLPPGPAAGPGSQRRAGPIYAGGWNSPVPVTSKPPPAPPAPVLPPAAPVVRRGNGVGQGTPSPPCWRPSG